MAAGNDDLMEVDPVIDNATTIVNADLKKVMVQDYEMITLSWSNPTPWDTEREYPEETLETKIDELAGQVENMETAIFNLHVPPYDTQIDQAPKLSDRLVPSTDEAIPAGSKAVLAAINKYQPMLGLHGHIHESRGIQKIGRTLCINPGSEYSEGILRGVIVILKKNKIKASKEQIQEISQVVKQHHAKQNKDQILKRFDQCKMEFSHLKADLSEEELLALAKPIIERKK